MNIERASYICWLHRLHFILHNQPSTFLHRSSILNPEESTKEDTLHINMTVPKRQQLARPPKYQKRK